MLGAAEVHAGRRLERGVGAAVEERLHLPGHDPPVARHPRAQRDHRGVARVARHQLLGVAHDHLDRPARHAGQVVGERQIHQRALAAEVAADGRQVDPDLLLRELERERQQLLEPVRHLVRRPHLDAAVLVDRHDAGVRLEIALVRELRAEGVLEDAIGLAEPGLDVAELEAEHGLDVRWGRSAGAPSYAPGFSCTTGAPLSSASAGSMTAGRSSYSTSMSASRLLRDVRIGRGDDRDLLADEAHAIAGEQRHVEHPPPDEHVRQVGRVRTASTPGSARAREVSIRRMRACGSGLRSALPQISPGSATSPE